MQPAKIQVMAISPQAQTATVTNPTVATSSAQLVAASSGRKGMIIANESTGIVYLLFGTGTASSTNHSVPLAAGTTYEHVYGTSGYSGPVQAVAVTAGPVALTIW